MKKKLLPFIAAGILISGCGTSQKELPVTFTADLTHDGKDETIEISAVTERQEQPDTQKITELKTVSFTVKDEENGILYEDSVTYMDSSPVPWPYQPQYFLIEEDGEDYLLRYTAIAHMNYVECEYEIFYLAPDGETAVYLDADGNIEDETEAGYGHGRIVVTADKVRDEGGGEELDVKEWATFADRLNGHLENGFLLMKAVDINLNLQFSTEEKHIAFQEDFSSLVETYQYEEGSTMAENLEKIKEYTASLREIE